MEPIRLARRALDRPRCASFPPPPPPRQQLPVRPASFVGDGLELSPVARPRAPRRRALDGSLGHRYLLLRFHSPQSEANKTNSAAWIACRRLFVAGRPDRCQAVWSRGAVWGRRRRRSGGLDRAGEWLDSEPYCKRRGLLAGRLGFESSAAAACGMQITCCIASNVSLRAELESHDDRDENAAWPIRGSLGSRRKRQLDQLGHNGNKFRPAGQVVEFWYQMTIWDSFTVAPPRQVGVGVVSRPAARLKPVPRPQRVLQESSGGCAGAGSPWMNHWPLVCIS